MQATIFEITNETREASFGVVSINQFQLRCTGEVAAQDVVTNPHISLFCLDFEGRRAVFVETPEDVDLSHVPFCFVVQFEQATRVLTISFETLLALAESIAIDDSRLVFIHSVGRCGSTLASQLFAQVPLVANLSEPDALTNLVVARNAGVHDATELRQLLRATVRLLCCHSAGMTAVIKGRSFVIELADWLHALFPRAKHLFLYREAESWLQSGRRAFGRTETLTEEEAVAREKQGRQYMGALAPTIAQFDPNRRLPHAGMLTLMWLAAMECYVQLCELPIDTLAIRYSSWKQQPRATAEAMLRFCNTLPEDMCRIDETLNRDSQAGTRLSQDALSERARADAHDFAELRWHLQNHAFVNSADYEVPNTLSMVV